MDTELALMNKLVLCFSFQLSHLKFAVYVRDDHCMFITGITIHVIVTDHHSKPIL